MVRRLTLVIHALSGGGAERVMASMADHWAAAGHEVTLITLDDGQDDAIPVSSRVQRVALDLLRESPHVVAAIHNNIARIRALRAALRDSRPDFVVAFTDQIAVLTLLAATGTRIPIVVSERADPRHHPLGRSWQKLRRWTYPRAAAIVVQTESVGTWIRPLAAGRPVHVIPNAAFAPTVDEHQAAEEIRRGRAPDSHVIVAAGRLSREKGFDMLVEAFALAAKERSRTWQLDIFGTGIQHDVLSRQIERLGLEDQAILRGWTEQLGVQLAAADLFVLPSRYEGFPNVLLEAMARGTAVAAFDCESGPGDIIRHEIDGLLVPPNDIPKLAAAIGRLMDDKELRQRLANHAREVVERFSPSRFYEQWEEIFSPGPA